MKKVLSLLFLALPLLSVGQKNYKLSFGTSSYQEIKKNPASRFKDSSEALNYCREFRIFAVKKGYLLASIDSIRYAEKEMTVSFYAGPKFKNTRLVVSPENLSFLKATGGFTEKLIRNVAFNPREIGNFMRQVQQTYENNGYPFCRVFLDSIRIDDELQAKLVVQEQQEFRIAKINLPGDPLISKKLISSYIQIRVGELYDQSQISLISSRLKQISFIEESKAAELLFTPDGVEIFLYLKAKPVSLVNGVIGLQPDPVKGKLSLTGELRLKLVNVLKKAEYLELNWRSIQAQTQSLKIQSTIPNLFQTPFGLDGQFNLYKRDSTYLELKSTIGVQYALNQGNFLKAFYRRYSSNVLSGGSGNPDFSNLKAVETNFYGLSLSRQNVDYLPNPRKGLTLLVEATIGMRKTKDSLVPLVQTTYKGEIQLQWYLPLAKRHVLKLANFTEIYVAPTYYQNEVFRFGGQISLRGFNEEELFATSRSVSTVEYRFLLDRNSFLFAFFDQGWYENKSTKFKTDTPFGFGAGFTFGTNIGNFSVSYALGKQLSNQIQLRDGKVHFGYIAYF